MTDEARAIAEIERLHVFFTEWFQGSIPAGSLGPELAEALHQDFEYIMPSGTMLKRDKLLTSIGDMHGSNPAFRIEIREPRLVTSYASPSALLMTYVEAQFGAKASVPADNLRRTSVVFDASGQRLLWRYIHETALPAA